MLTLRGRKKKHCDSFREICNALVNNGIVLDISVDEGAPPSYAHMKLHNIDDKCRFEIMYCKNKRKVELSEDDKNAIRNGEKAIIVQIKHDYFVVNVSKKKQGVLNKIDEDAYDVVSKLLFKDKNFKKENSPIHVTDPKQQEIARNMVILYDSMTNKEFKIIFGVGVTGQSTSIHKFLDMIQSLQEKAYKKLLAYDELSGNAMDLLQAARYSIQNKLDITIKTLYALIYAETKKGPWNGWGKKRGYNDQTPLHEIAKNAAKTKSDSNRAMQILLNNIHVRDDKILEKGKSIELQTTLRNEFADMLVMGYINGIKQLLENKNIKKNSPTNINVDGHQQKIAENVFTLYGRRSTRAKKIKSVVKKYFIEPKNRENMEIILTC